MPKKSNKKAHRPNVAGYATSERNKTIVALCETKSVKEIAEQFGISTQRVSQIWKRAKLVESGQENAPPKPRTPRSTLIDGVRMNYEEAVVSAVDQYWKTHFRSPTLRELRTLTGIPSQSHIRDILWRIAEKYNWRVSPVFSRTITPQWVVAAIEQANPHHKDKSTQVKRGT